MRHICREKKHRCKMANEPLQNDRLFAIGKLIRLLTVIGASKKVSAIQAYAAGNRQHSKWPRAPF